MEKIRQTTPHGGLKPAPTQDAGPTYMSRKSGKGKKGNGNSLPPVIDYGLGKGGDEIVRMSRTGGKGPGGTGFTLEAKGPGRSGRSASSKRSFMGRDYGVGGVTGGGGNTYGV